MSQWLMLGTSFTKADKVSNIIWRRHFSCCSNIGCSQKEGKAFIIYIFYPHKRYQQIFQYFIKIENLILVLIFRTSFIFALLFSDGEVAGLRRDVERTFQQSNQSLPHIVFHLSLRLRNFKCIFSKNITFSQKHYI